MKRREFGMMLVTAASGLAMRLQERRPGLRVDGKRLNYHLTELSQYGRNPQGGVSRVAYSDADLQAREYVKGLMGAAKLQVSVDAAANIIGRKRGLDPSLPPLVIGSHIDSVPEGGQQGSTFTPAQSLTNTATSLTGAGGPLATLVFGLILVASLGTLAYANVQAARRRR